MFTLLALALLIACALWALISLRKYAARKQLEEKRAAALMAGTLNAAKKAKPARDKA